MKWISHKICTFAGVYAISDNLALSVAVSAFSHLPDLVEFGPGKLIFKKHRGASHSPMLWLGFIVLSWLCSYTALVQHTEGFFGKYGFTSLCVLIPAIGAFFHLAEDAMSKSGIVVWKGTKLAAGLYKTGTRMEGAVVLAVVILCAVPFAIRRLLDCLL